jgi:co-chaperonin GroES (HSP10)
MTLKLFGQRIALTEVKEELEGSILLPESRTRSFYIGRIIAVGDGLEPDGKVKPMWVSAGDLVMFQLIGAQVTASQFIHESNKVRILHQGDVIARLKSNVVKMDNFEILGDWVLSKVEMQSGTTLVVPDSARQPDMFTFKLEQKGAGVEHDIQKGEEVYVERMRCNPVEIDRVTYAFCHKSDVHGVAKA